MRPSTPTRKPAQQISFFYISIPLFFPLWSYIGLCMLLFHLQTNTNKNSFMPKQKPVRMGRIPFFPFLFFCTYNKNLTERQRWWTEKHLALAYDHRQQQQQQQQNRNLRGLLTVLLAFWLVYWCIFSIVYFFLLLLFQLGMGRKRDYGLGKSQKPNRLVVNMFRRETGKLNNLLLAENQILLHFSNQISENRCFWVLVFAVIWNGNRKEKDSARMKWQIDIYFSRNVCFMKESHFTV